MQNSDRRKSGKARNPKNEVSQRHDKILYKMQLNLTFDTRYRIFKRRDSCGKYIRGYFDISLQYILLNF